MKRIVMLLVFALVIPSVLFSADKTLKDASDQEILEETQKRLKNFKPQEQEIPEEARIQNRKEEVWGQKIQQDQQEKFLRSRQTMRIGLNGGYSFGANTNKSSLIWGAQLESPEWFMIENAEKKYFNNIQFSLSGRLSATMIGDEWFLYELSHIITDTTIQSYGLSAIFRVYFGDPNPVVKIEDKEIFQKRMLYEAEEGPETLYWVGALAGINYNLFNVDENRINANVSKDFDNSKIGFNLGLCGGVRFKNSFLYRTWEIFLEGRYNFVRVDAVEKGAVWGTTIAKEVTENHDFLIAIIGVNMFF